MDIAPGLPATDNFQHWPPWRTLVVETARRVLEYTGGTLRYLEAYAEAGLAWLHEDGEVVDTTFRSPGEVARKIGGSHPANALTAGIT
nr:hypothetical protein [Cryptosporangium phraense]